MALITPVNENAIKAYRFLRSVPMSIHVEKVSAQGLCIRAKQVGAYGKDGSTGISVEDHYKDFSTGVIALADRVKALIAEIAPIATHTKDKSFDVGINALKESGAFPSFFEWAINNGYASVDEVRKAHGLEPINAPKPAPADSLILTVDVDMEPTRAYFAEIEAGLDRISKAFAALGIDPTFGIKGSVEPNMDAATCKEQPIARPESTTIFSIPAARAA